MVRNIISASGPAGWLRRGSLWAAVAGLAVLTTGGAALASTATATTTTPQIKACYLPGSNPSALAGSAPPGRKASGVLPYAFDPRPLALPRFGSGCHGIITVGGAG